MEVLENNCSFLATAVHLGSPGFSLRYSYHLMPLCGAGFRNFVYRYLKMLVNGVLKTFKRELPFGVSNHHVQTWGIRAHPPTPACSSWPARRRLCWELLGRAPFQRVDELLRRAPFQRVDEQVKDLIPLPNHRFHTTLSGLSRLVFHCPTILLSHYFAQLEGSQKSGRG